MRALVSTWQLRGVATARAHLFGKLPGAREDGFDVGGGRSLASDLRQVDGVVQRQRRLVLRPELAQIEARASFVKLVVEALPTTWAAK